MAAGENLPVLPEVARLALSAGRMLLEWGANARVVHEGISNIARGLGCDSAEAFCQHAAIIVMLRRGRMPASKWERSASTGLICAAHKAFRTLSARVAGGRFLCRSPSGSGRCALKSAAYPVWFVCLSTGLACSAFGRLLGGRGGPRFSYPRRGGIRTVVETLPASQAIQYFPDSRLGELCSSITRRHRRRALWQRQSAACHACGGPVAGSRSGRAQRAG